MPAQQLAASAVAFGTLVAPLLRLEHAVVDQGHVSDVVDALLERDVAACLSAKSPAITDRIIAEAAALRAAGKQLSPQVRMNEARALAELAKNK